MMFEPQSDDLQRLIAETIPQMIWVKRGDGFVEFYNSWGATYHGLPVERLLGWGWLDAVHPEQQAEARVVWARPAAQETVREATYRMRRADGMYRWHLMRGAPVRDAQGMVERWIGTSTDIEDQKQAERQAVETLAMLDTLQSTASIGLVFLDRSWRYVHINDTAAAVGGLPAAAHIGHTAAEVLPDSWPRLEPLYRRVMETGEPLLDLKITRVDTEHPASTRYVIASHYPVEIEGRRVGLGIVTIDVTRQHQAEAERAAAQRQKLETLALLDTLQSNAPIGFGFIDREFRFVRCNDTLAVIDGMSAAAHIGRTVQEIVPAIWPQIEPMYRRVLEYNEAVVNVEISGTTIAAPDVERQWLASYYPVEVQRECIGIGIVVLEVSELKRLEAQSLQSQKMEAIGRLAGGIAHDFNNLLTVINGYAALLLEDSDTQDTRQEAVTAIHYAGEQASLLTHQLLAFSRRQVLNPTLLDLGAVVLQMEGLLKRLLSEDIRLTTVVQPLTGRVYADPGQIEQVIMNLVINARDAMPHEGSLLIETRQLTLPVPLIGIKELLPAGSYVALMVRDSGAGMDAHTLAHLFEPFFTTKTAGKGTGLGLATVYGIAKQSQGFVQVESTLGSGSTFSVYFPAIATDDVTRETEGATPPVPGAGELVLLLEDDAGVRGFVRHVLQRHGYNVVEVLSVADALRLVSDDKLPIRLVLTDVVLPESSGRILGDQLAQRRPDLPVIFMSGYTDEEISRRGIDSAAPRFLSKPFSPAVLVQKVRGVLNEYTTP